MELTQEYLQSIFEYHPDGFFTRKQSYFKPKLGTIVKGTKNINGYWIITVNKKWYILHRLIFLYHHGFLPEIVDHKDRKKTNNKIENLRAATVSENSWNSDLQSNNKSGTSGVSYDKQRNKWVAEIRVKNKHIKLGRFESLDAAKEKRKEAEKTYYGVFCP